MVRTEPDEATTVRLPAVPRRPGLLAGLRTAPLAVAVLFGCLALTPSLVPRSPAFQGVVSGVAAACGYGVGLLLLQQVRRRTSWRPGPRARLVARVMIWVSAAVAVSVMLTASARWQAEVHRLVGEEPPGPGSPLLIVAVAAGVFLVVVGVGRLLRALVRLGRRPLSVVLPGTLASALSVLLVVLAAGAVLDQLVLRTALSAVDSSFDALNNEIPDGLEAPTSPLRSGSPESLAPWDELGLQGRQFVVAGPDVDELTELTGSPATEPIRVYAGLDTSEDLDRLAAVAVRELERTGAFDRAVLCVVTPTGRGWVNPQAAAALERLHGGDTAIVSMQYSYLPSPLSFLVDPQRAREAGEQLFDQVHERWSRLPADNRPRLVVYGESLGSTGAQAAFSGLGDVRARTDGALFVGPPESNSLWAELVERRDPGSRQVLPVYDDGLTARFVAAPGEYERAGAAPWQQPRVLFAQHSSDPIVWWSPKLLLIRPDWLEQQRGPDVSPRMHWYPLVTFWQVTADMAVANSTPPGHGHRYRGFLQHWAALVPPDGWTERDTARLEQGSR